MNTIVNVSDARVSANPAEVLATYALGSCIGVTMHDALAGVGGMLHYQLPASTIDPQKAAERPFMFADTGMAWLLQKLCAAGADKRRLRIKLAGAAQMLNDNNLFSIGRRNHAAIRKILWQQGFLIDGEDVGGITPRNMHLAIADGTVTITTMGAKAAL